MDEESYLSKFLSGLTEILSFIATSANQSTTCIKKVVYPTKERVFHMYDTLTNNFETLGSQGFTMVSKDEPSTFGHIERQLTTSTI